MSNKTHSYGASKVDLRCFNSVVMGFLGTGGLEYLICEVTEVWGDCTITAEWRDVAHQDL
jgi:hypothetical protein